MSTFSILCPSCGEELLAVDHGFEATCVETTGPCFCGTTGRIVRKSVAYATAKPAMDLRHVSGLVTFG